MSQNSFAFLEIEKNKQYYNKTYYQDSELHPILLLINSQELRNEIRQYVQLTVTNRPKLLSEPVRNWYKTLNRQITGSINLQSGIPRYSSRKSFYQKATIMYPPKPATKLWTGVESILKSYETIVAIQLTNGNFYINGKWSSTTTSHQVEYAKQCGHDVNATNIIKYDLEK